jgi:hypothetical protein
VPTGHGDAAGAGRGAAFEEIFAEFYAVGAALLGPQGRFDGVYADFDEGPVGVHVLIRANNFQYSAK